MGEKRQDQCSCQGFACEWAILSISHVFVIYEDEGDDDDNKSDNDLQ